MKLSRLFKFSAVLVLLFCFAAVPAHADFSETQTIVFQRDGFVLNSPLIVSEKEFNVAILKVPADLKKLEVNFNPRDPLGWEPVEMHDDGFGIRPLLFTRPTRAFLLRSFSYDLSQTFTVEADLSFEQATVAAIPSEVVASEVAMAKGVPIITRKAWGADESIRYWNPDTSDANGNGDKDKPASVTLDPCEGVAKDPTLGVTKVVDKSPTGELLIWPIAYMKKVQKLIVHHTDSDLKDLNGDLVMDGRDYSAMVRAIYRYHAITRGWGDIGYNYIIDPLGNIYEGRAGGDGAIGAHALCHNNGAIGISVIGNYENIPVPEPAVDSLINLLALKAQEFNIDPQGESVFHGESIPNILGHRDVRPTACPGKNLYGLLPLIRGRASLISRFSNFSDQPSQVNVLDYNAEPVSALDKITLLPNERRHVTVQFKNTGKQAWDSNTWLHVALNNNKDARVVPIIADKPFVAADMREVSVPPGSLGTFELDLEGGYNGGFFSFEIAPVANSRFKISRGAMHLAFGVESPRYDYEVVTNNLPKDILYQGQKRLGSIDLKNTGNTVWTNYGENPITLGTTAPQDRKSILVGKNPTRLGYLSQSEVRPGETGHFIVELEAPEDKEGKVTERFTPVIEGIKWLQDKGLNFEVTLKKPRHLAVITQKDDLSVMTPGEMRKVLITYKNMGDLPWTYDDMHVDFESKGLKVFKNQLAPLEDVAPGKSVTFDFWIQALYEGGTHSLALNSKYRKTPILGGNVKFNIDVQSPVLRATLVEQKQQDVITLRPGQEYEITLKYKNIGNVVWRNKGPNAVYIAPTDPKDRLSKMYNPKSWPNKYRAAVLKDMLVNPGETGTFVFKIRPTVRGTFRENFALVMENVDWLESSTAKFNIKVAGIPLKSSSSAIDALGDAKLNRDRASIITKAVTPAPAAPSPALVDAVQRTASSSDIRVKLSFNGDRTDVSYPEAYKVFDGAGRLLFNVGGTQKVVLERSGNEISVTFGGVKKSHAVIRIQASKADSVFTISAMEKRPAWNTSLNDNKFRGTLEVQVVNDKTTYIDELNLEDYLKGVAEVPNTEPFEKQKVLAVLARTYASFYMQEENRKFPGLPYDASDDPDVFQKYLGYGYEVRSPNFVGAVVVTSNEVVTYQGKLVKTPYFTQSDGRTRSAEEVWGWKNSPWLKSVDDPYCAGLEKKGHGVGLSGFGATKMAEAGKLYDEIIKYYYTGVAIEDKKL
jgi:hypothetical protein